MKRLLLTTIAAVVLAGCAKAPVISIHEAVISGKIEAVSQSIAAGANVNAKGVGGLTPLLFAAQEGQGINSLQKETNYLLDQLRQVRSKYTMWLENMNLERIRNL